jgi:hypothetical protein
LAGKVGQFGGGDEGGVGDFGGGDMLVVHAAIEVEVGFKAVEQPGLQGALELGIPGFGVPATFIFGLFDESDIFVGLDDLDAVFDELFVVVGPMIGVYNHATQTRWFQVPLFPSDEP